MKRTFFIFGSSADVVEERNRRTARRRWRIIAQDGKKEMQNDDGRIIRAEEGRSGREGR
jgi:hypothetical protein